MENYKGENSPSETQTLASKVKPGEYVKYIPDKVNTTDEAYTNLISDLGTYSGNGENTALTQEEMNWRVLDVVNGKVRLISENPTSNNVTLSGYNGYNNAVYLLDKTCRTLYNKTGYTENIQNLKIEDIQNKMTTTDYSAIYPSYGTPLSPTNLYYPSIFAQEEGQKIDGTTGTLGLSKQTDPIEQTIIEIYPEESWEVKFTYWTKTMEENDFTNPIYYNLFINNDTNSYWMSSRCVSADSDYAAFNVRSVYSGSVNALNLYVSSSASASYSIGFRPVITLNSNVSVTSGDGTKSLPYVIGL